jgi:hypothetical protein
MTLISFTLVRKEGCSYLLHKANPPYAESISDLNLHEQELSICMLSFVFSSLNFGAACVEGTQVLSLVPEFPQFVMWYISILFQRWLA